mgnify:CR=1 FL=1
MYKEEGCTCFQKVHLNAVSMPLLIIAAYCTRVSWKGSLMRVIQAGHQEKRKKFWKISGFTCHFYAFVNLIPVAEQCSSTTRIGPHYCGHRTGAVLEHCLAPLESYDSSTAVSAVTGRSGVLVTVLGHCHCLMTQSLLP